MLLIDRLQFKLKLTQKDYEYYHLDLTSYIGGQKLLITNKFIHNRRITKDYCHCILENTIHSWGGFLIDKVINELMSTNTYIKILNLSSYPYTKMGPMYSEQEFEDAAFKMRNRTAPLDLITQPSKEWVSGFKAGAYWAIHERGGS